MMIQIPRTLLLLTVMVIVSVSPPPGKSDGERNNDAAIEIAAAENPEPLPGFDAVEPTLAIAGGWLIDGTGQVPYGDSVVLVGGERILAVGRRNQIPVPPNVEFIDARGKTVLPGIIDGHNHLEGIGLGDDDREFTNSPEKLRQVILQNAQLDLWSGVTSVRDMGSSDLVLELRDQIEAVGPRLFAAGSQLVKRSVDAPPIPNTLDFDGPKEARQRVRELIAKGVDLIKVRLVLQRPLPTLDELKAIIKAAHEGGLKVAAHTDVPHTEAVRLAIEAGVDSLEHAAALRVADDLLFRRMVRQNIILVPTLFQFQAQQLDPLTRSDDELIESPLAEMLPPEWLQGLKQRAAIWRRNLEEWRALRQYDPQHAVREYFNALVRADSLGVKLTMGPDTGSDLVPHGRIYRTLEFPSSAGLPAMDVIKMYGKNGAEVLGKEKVLGTVEPGKYADIIIVDGDPTFNPLAFRRVLVVIKNGKVVKAPPIS